MLRFGLETAQAFAADDSAAAFSHAAPNVQSRFATPENFMAMVQSAYPVVWRPASVAFGRVEWDGDDLIAAVRMQDAQGSPWLVLYRLQRRAGENWRIAACNIARSPGRST
ncbi:MAG: DUF4864 domain-containing protein [Salinisphaera sp.]|nr:DUF4864 domain-containing protein [Salinisphaera sp.]